MTTLTPYLLAALGAILMWGAKLIVGAIRDMNTEIKELRGELAAHHSATGERLATIERDVEAIQYDVKDIEQRVRNLEMMRSK